MYEKIKKHLQIKWQLRLFIGALAIYFLYMLFIMYDNGSISIRGSFHYQDGESDLFETRALKYKVYSIMLLYFSLIKKYKPNKTA